MTTAYSEQGYYPLDIESDSNVVIESGSTPVRNMVATAKDNTETETFSGWLKVEVPSERTCRITALVDDNGSFSINGATTEIASGTHGSRRYTPEVQVTLKPGYYFVQCRLEDLPPLNQAYSNVKHFQAFIKWNDDNGNEVTQAVTQLFDISENAEVVYNLMKKSDAQRLMDCYRNYQYAHTDSNGVPVSGKTSAEVYAAVGGNIGPKYGQSGYTNSCALRVTQAMCDYGITLPDEPDLQSNNPGAILGYYNKDNKTVYIRAVSVINYLCTMLGQPTFTNYAQFQTWLSELENTEFDIQNDDKPIVIWGEEAGTDHVGMGFSGEGSSFAGAISVAEKIWVLYSPRCADPIMSAL